jgi:hypothetical protein
VIFLAVVLSDLMDRVVLLALEHILDRVDLQATKDTKEVKDTTEVRDLRVAVDFVEV